MYKLLSRAGIELASKIAMVKRPTVCTWRTDLTPLGTAAALCITERAGASLEALAPIPLFTVFSKGAPSQISAEFLQ